MKINLWDIVTILLPMLLGNTNRSKEQSDSMFKLVAQGVSNAATMEGKSDSEKQKLAIEYAKPLIKQTLGISPKNAELNLLVELAVAAAKGG